MQYELWEKHKDKWSPLEPLYADKIICPLIYRDKKTAFFRAQHEQK
jgi:hypothetical protein